jgi:archaellum component FlaG (FlaF/FlaG flagellin family)
MTTLLHILAVLVCVCFLAVFVVAFVLWRMAVHAAKDARTKLIHSMHDTHMAHAQAMTTHFEILKEHNHRLMKLEARGRQREESMN